MRAITAVALVTLTGTVLLVPAVQARRAEDRGRADVGPVERRAPASHAVATPPADDQGVRDLERTLAEGTAPRRGR